MTADQNWSITFSDTGYNSTNIYSCYLLRASMQKDRTILTIMSIFHFLDSTTITMEHGVQEKSHRQETTCAESESHGTPRSQVSASCQDPSPMSRRQRHSTTTSKRLRSTPAVGGPPTTVLRWQDPLDSSWTRLSLV